MSHCLCAHIPAFHFRYEDSYYKYKVVGRSSYLYNGNPYTTKTAALYHIVFAYKYIYIILIYLYIVQQTCTKIVLSVISSFQSHAAK